MKKHITGSIVEEPTQSDAVDDTSLRVLCFPFINKNQHVFPSSFRPGASRHRHCHRLLNQRQSRKAYFVCETLHLPPRLLSYHHRKYTPWKAFAWSKTACPWVASMMRVVLSGCTVSWISFISSNKASSCLWRPDVSTMITWMSSTQAQASGEYRHTIEACHNSRRMSPPSHAPPDYYASNK